MLDGLPEDLLEGLEEVAYHLGNVIRAGTVENAMNWATIGCSFGSSAIHELRAQLAPGSTTVPDTLSGLLSAQAQPPLMLDNPRGRVHPK